MRDSYETLHLRKRSTLRYLLYDIVVLVTSNAESVSGLWRTAS